MQGAEAPVSSLGIFRAVDQCRRLENVMDNRRNGNTGKKRETERV